MFGIPQLVSGRRRTGSQEGGSGPHTVNDGTQASRTKTLRTGAREDVCDEGEAGNSKILAFRREKPAAKADSYEIPPAAPEVRR